MRYINQATTYMYVYELRFQSPGRNCALYMHICTYVFKNIATDTIRLRMSENIIKLINTWGVYLRVSTI